MENSIGNELVYLIIAEKIIKELSNCYNHNIKPEPYRIPDYDTTTYEQDLRCRAAEPLQNVNEIDYTDLEDHNITINTKRVKLEKVNQLLSNEKELINRIRNRVKENIFKIKNEYVGEFPRGFIHNFVNTNNSLTFYISCDKDRNQVSIKDIRSAYGQYGHSDEEPLGIYEDYVGKVL